MSFQFIGYILGVLITVLGLAEMVPAIIDWRLDHENARMFFLNGIICLFFGGSLILSNRSSAVHVNVRQAFMLTVASWLVVSLFAALPLYMSDLNLTLTDAVFEAVSGVTTTGASVLSGIDEMSHGILFWRSMMQWIGGIGIIAFAAILLPYLKVGGMQLFRMEAAEQSEKAMPRSVEIVFSLLQVYVLLTGLCASAYYVAGMSWFDAINHAMTTISTGGFSTHDASLGYFQSTTLEYIAIFFMVLGALPFILYLRLFFQRKFRFFRDEQVKTFFLVLVALVSVMALWLSLNSSYSIETSIRYALFSVTSVLTTTGYAVSDYTLWGNFAVIFFLFLCYIGGCAGATSGGVKMMRVSIVAKVVARQFKTLLYPNGVFVLNYQGRRLDSYTVLTVLGFLSLYVVSNVLLTIILALVGVDFVTAMSGAAAALANVGPGVGEVIGPGGSYATLPVAAKWILAGGMILGRLEILSVVVLFSYTYWKR